MASWRALRWTVAGVLLATSAAIYSWRLATAPVYLGGDEARFGVHAYALSQTGRDIDHQFLPLYIHLDDLGWWYQPTLFYLIALALTVAPLTEATIRTPTVVTAIVNLILVYAVGRRLWADRRTAFAAAALL